MMEQMIKESQWASSVQRANVCEVLAERESWAH